MKRLKSLAIRFGSQGHHTHPSVYPRNSVLRKPRIQADIDGWIVVMEQGDDITRIEEIGDDGLFTDDVPNFEYVEAFLDGDQVTFDLVYKLDDSRTVAVIIRDAPWLDPSLRNILREASGALLPLPQIKEMMP